MSLSIATEALEAAYYYARKGRIPTGRTYDEIEGALRVAKAALEKERRVSAEYRAKAKEREE